MALLAFPLVSFALRVDFRGQSSPARSWKGAVGACASVGARLAVISSDGDNAAVHAAARAAGIGGGFWIGGSRVKGDRWEWATSHIDFESSGHWATHVHAIVENEQGRNEGCLRAGADGDMWTSAKCWLKHGYVCEYRGKLPLFCVPFRCEYQDGEYQYGEYQYGGAIKLWPQ